MNNLFQNCTQPAISCIGLINFVNNHLRIALKTDRRQALLHTPNNSFPKHKNFHYDWIIQMRKLDPSSQQERLGWVKKNHPTSRMRPTLSSLVPHANKLGITHMSIGQHYWDLYHRCLIRWKTHPLLIVLVKLSHERRDPKLLALKDYPFSRSPDPPKDSNNRHNHRRLMDQTQQTLKKQWKGMPRQTLSQILQSRIIPESPRNQAIKD
ncbi:unnamed protein product [Linum trigynum]|uniref:Uncharacterized protein n=1 Tax=Linum trigynum TaxID=586398 RepID=A0AAV2F4N6_9ROSI